MSQASALRVHRRGFIKAAGAAMAGASMFLLPKRADAAWPTLREGDIFAVRNQWFNIVPGYWNHVALYSSGSIYEAQPSTGVRPVPFMTFFNYYPTIRVLRLNAQFLVPRMVWYAKQLVGTPYGILPEEDGVSCVMYVRSCYYFSTLVYAPDDPEWLIPDHVVADGNRLLSMGQK